MLRRVPTTGKLLIDEVAYVRENGFAQFHAQQSSAGSCAQILFKTLKDVCGQIRLLPKQMQQLRAIGSESEWSIGCVMRLTRIEES
jgi:hypothetical protein